MHAQKKVMLATVVVVVLAAVTGAWAATAKSQGAYERIKSTGTVSIGFFYEPPTVFIDPATGKLTGESPTVARAVLNKVFGKDLKMDGVLVSEFGSLIPGVQAGRFDIVASGLYIRKQRCAQVLFGDPQAIIHSGLVVKKGNPLNLHSYKSLRDTNGVIAAIAEGGSELDWARKVGVTDDKLLIVQNYEQAIAAFDAGRVNVIVGPAIALQYRLTQVWKNTDKYELADPFEDPIINGQKTIAYYATAFRIGDEDLRDAYNKEFDALRSSGGLLKLVEPFGFRKSDIPATETQAELCKTQQ